MRNASANNTGNNTYSDLVANCQHSRLKAALSSPTPGGARRAYVAVAATPIVTEATKAYLWVVCMSVLSLVSVVIGGAITA